MTTTPVRTVARWMLWLPGDPLKLERWPLWALPVVFVVAAVRACVYRPVKLAVALCAVWFASAEWWLGLIPVILAVGLDRLLGSRSSAASGRRSGAYRACQARGRIRRDWAQLLLGTGAVKAGGKVPRHGWIRRTDCGLRVRVHHGQAGITVAALQEKADVLAGLIGGVHSVRLRRHNADWCTLYVNLISPLAGTIPASQLPAAPFPYVTLGRSVEGYWLRANLINTHFKILAQSGGGKSSLLWDMIMGAEQWDTPPEWWIVDPKMGIELGAMDPDAGGVATRYTEDGRMAARFFDELWAEGVRRGAIAKAMGRRSWDPALGPVIIMVVDEFLALGAAATKKGGSLFKILTQLRALGIVVIGCSQLPQVETGALGRIGQLFPSSIVGATGGPGMTVSALGDYAQNEAPAHLLQLPQDAGKFYMVEEGRSGYAHFKAGYLDDEHGEHLPVARGEMRKAKPIREVLEEVVT